MTVLVTTDIAASRADVEAVAKDLADTYDSPPDGLILHLATETDGGVRIVDVWETADHQERFMTERLGASMAKVIQERGLTMSGPPSTTVDEVFDFVHP